tara:strand:+ start:18860 stop:19546 length:687 start_codon:yes stop_codon:yes gene_type:complete
MSLLSPAIKRALFGATVGGAGAHITSKKTFKPDAPVKSVDEFGMRRIRPLTPAERQRRRNRLRKHTALGAGISATLLPMIIGRRIKAKNLKDAADWKKNKSEILRHLTGEFDAAKRSGIAGGTARSEYISKKKKSIIKEDLKKLLSGNYKGVSKQTRDSSLFGSDAFRHYIKKSPDGTYKLHKRPSKDSATGMALRDILGKNYKGGMADFQKSYKEYLRSRVRPEDII